MRFQPTRTVDPVALAVPLYELKDHLRITTAEQDIPLTRTLTRAIDFIERLIGRSLMRQTWELAIDSEWCSIWGDYILLPKPPLYATSPIVSFNSYTSSDVEVAVSSSSYLVDVPGHRLILKQGYTWPEDLRPVRSLVVTYLAGYSAENHESVPASIRQAICQVGAHFHVHREALLTGTISKEIELGVRDLLAPFNENLGV
jgi:uncharacterized phiE125 gp8 family phage protein